MRYKMETEMTEMNYLQIGNRAFARRGRTYVMGILNVTPDSFSDGGQWTSRDAALYRVEQMIAEGADIIDVGGESTRPGYTQLSDDEEISRIEPVVSAVKARFDIPVSLDTYKSKVAEAGITAGADMINDIWGLKYDSEMAPLIARSKIPCCLMHNRKQADYEDFLEDVKKDLRESLDLAQRAGIERDRIILDPGVGFGKTYEDNLQVLNSMEQFSELGCPVLLGCSRKSVIGLTLDLPTNQRLEGTLTTTVMAVMKGISFVRIHDIKENVRAIRMAETILGRRISS